MPVDDLYLSWLYSQVGSVKLRNPSRTYWSLLRQLYTKEFVWFVPNDDNRVEDGRELRLEFIEDQQIGHVDPEWMRLGCSVLEMLIGLSRRLSFEAGGGPRDWFWHLLKNLGLSTLTDQQYTDALGAEVDDTLDRLIWRRYHFDGRGGLFPLKHCTQNQCEVEIWYQLNAYLLERD